MKEIKKQLLYQFSVSTFCSKAKTWVNLSHSICKVTQLSGENTVNTYYNRRWLKIYIHAKKKKRDYIHGVFKILSTYVNITKYRVALEKQ